MPSSQIRCFSLAPTLIVACLCFAPASLAAQTTGTNPPANPATSNGSMSTDAVLATGLPERPTASPPATKTGPAAGSSQQQPQMPIALLAAWVTIGTLLALLYLLRNSFARDRYQTYAADDVDSDKENA